MSITFKYRGTCVLCGFRLRGIWVASARINRRSIRTLSGVIALVDRRCPECNTPNEDRSGPWALDEESVANIAAYRERKWGVAA